MPSSPLPHNEAGRLEALRRYNILDTPPEAGFDRITALAARLFNVPVALISLVDDSRAWFKSAYGFDRQMVQRQASICSYALLTDQVLVLPDVRQDQRFASNPLVHGEPGVRFYAGAPLLTKDGFAVGTLCILDAQPRDGLSADQQSVLADLAALVVDELDLRLAAHRVAEIDAALVAVTQGVAAQTGTAFFAALVQHLTHTLGVDYAYIGLVNGDRQDAVKTIAACVQGKIADNFEYLLHHTPCHQVLLKRKLCCYPGGVKVQFPDAPLLQPLGIDSYAAIPFFDAEGTPMGLLGVMDGSPFTNVQLIEALLPIFALRIATELDRQHTDAARLRVQQDLEQLVAQRTAELSRTNRQLQLEIAERQQAEIALQTEQEMLRVLLENVQAGIVACNQAGILTLFNQAARDFHGLPEQPLPPEHWADYYDLYQPDGHTPLRKEDIPLFRALQGEAVDRVEMVIAPKGGEARTVSASGQAIAAADGSPQGAVVVMHDITDRKRMEDALRASEAQLASIFETIPDGVVIFNAQGQIVTVNSAAEKILRSNRQALAEHSYDNPPWKVTNLAGEPLATEDLPFMRVLHTGQPTHGVEMALDHSDGDRTILCVNASPLLDSRDGITHVIASISDITKRKEAELTLQASEERYRSVIETTAEGIILQSSDGTIYTCNASAADILGLTVEQLTGLSSLDPSWSTIHEDGSPFPGDQHPSMITLRTGMSQSNVVMGVNKPNGTLTWISINTRPLFHPNESTPFAVVASFFDITDRKLIEAERAQRIREQTARIDAEAGQFRSALLVDISTTLASLLNHTDTLQQVADRVVPFFADWCTIDLLNAERGMERVAVAHCDPAKVELAWQLHRRYPQPVGAPVGLAQVLRLDQTELMADISAVNLESVAQDPEHLRLLEGLGLRSCIAAPLIARGQILGIISFVTAQSNRRYTPTDLALAENVAHQVAIAVDNARLYQDEQTARSEAEAANRIKDEFLAVLSHELRSPLNPILGWSQLLQKRQPDPDTLIRGLQTIERNAKLQTQLIADLLDVSRILQGKLNLDITPVQLKATIEAAMETVRLAAEAKAIRLHTQLDADVPPVLGDAGRLQQVVWNLLSNAVKFTPEGGQVKIRLEAITPVPDHPIAQSPAGATHAQIVVTDTGQGITPEFIPYIFDRFRQADSKTTRQFGGLGLGLAIVRQLVELHGGTIAAVSPGAGLGATFTVRLPLPSNLKDATQETAAYALHRALQPAQLPGVRILVVEDEADARDLLVLVLEQAGAVVTAVTSAAEALRQLPQLELDVLISDIAMPDVDGYMLLQQVRSQLAQQGTQPTFKAVALTAYAGEINRQQALAAGFQRHLSKPFEPAELVAAIAALIK
ncbi:PAS domain S-box protein [Nodosilinea sp. LEGE 06152]|uniref:PAS domain S-box protein n=1 Tax=Nodosilinea sp. LEGE 06152 TaxID=2777966 RepID=UPI00187EA0F6|nr:PAS domain S-box protein [Nodosilinea sp. LEGE 06152]MBE9159791.1 PAS domain S-box protein [Nodosilinea sp. LEGE 06152]